MTALELLHAQTEAAVDSALVYVLDFAAEAWPVVKDEAQSINLWFILACDYLQAPYRGKMASEKVRQAYLKMARHNAARAELSE